MSEFVSYKILINPHTFKAAQRTITKRCKAMKNNQKKNDGLNKAMKIIKLAAGILKLLEGLKELLS
ncbi:MAG: hypothetical protein JXR03_21645 [Cyclobacteriaceae bacterium]